LGCIALGSAQEQWFDTEISAWHFHTYFFEVNPRSSAEVTSLRMALRQKINDGTFPECSLNEWAIGWDGPHPVSQFEMCCNKTSFAVAHSFYTQNHGNLSILVHPLTEQDQDDHISRVSWIGAPVVLDDECPCLYPVIPKPRPCPVYPNYPDEIPMAGAVSEFIPIPGTEDYKRRNKNFNILTDPY